MPDLRKRTPYWKRPETWFLAAAILILAFTGIIGWANWRAFSTTRAQARADRAAVEESDTVLSSLTEAEAGQRGFLLTGREFYLATYRRATAQIPQHLRQLRVQAPEQKAAIDELQRLIADKLAALNQTIELRRTAGLEAAMKLVLTDREWQSTEKIRAMCRGIAAREYREYYQGADKITTVTNRMISVLIGGDLALCVLLGMAAISIYSGAQRRESLIAALQDDERRLRELRETAETAEAQVRDILESIADGFVSFDKDWTITYCNAEAAKIFGRSKGEVTGRNFWKEFPELGGNEIESEYRTAAQQGKPRSFEAFVGGRNVYWEQSVYPAPGGLSVYFRDVTERRRLEERARQSHKLESLGVLAGGIAHDFNNLLTAILGNASLMLEDLPEHTPAHHLAENVIQASERATQLTRQMLAYSGRGRFVVENLDLALQVREITALLEAAITAGVELVLDLPTDGALIEADSGQIQQLIMNLVINGAEAIGPGGGRMVISTRVADLDEGYMEGNLAGDGAEPGTFLVLEVHDTGAGMDEATKARIFDPFFTTKFTGRGLGLAAVLGIVRGHRGGIKVYSNPGSGTTFKVFFPMVKGPLASKPQSLALDYRGSATILVVDDEEVVQRLAHSTLERYGYKVILASNGKEAIEVFESNTHRISLVLLDMTMPVMSGEETLTRLKKLQPDLRVIASSGYNEVEALRRFGQGVNAFLQKPYRSVQLAEKVKITLG